MLLFLFSNVIILLANSVWGKYISAKQSLNTCQCLHMCLCFRLYKNVDFLKFLFLDLLDRDSLRIGTISVYRTHQSNLNNFFLFPDDGSKSAFRNVFILIKNKKTETSHQ